MKKTRFEDRYGSCILRGGSWYNIYPSNFRAHYRNWENPDIWLSNQGFRCVAPESSPIVQRFERIK